MKFGSKWKAAVANLPLPLQKSCLSYKKWKKLSKGCDATGSLALLEKDCQQTNKVFKACFRILHKEPMCSGMFSLCLLKHNTYRTHITPEDLYAFAQLNKTALYKICKRMDKRQHVDAYRSWLHSHYHEYLFNYGLYIKRLSLEASPDISDSCPVCFKEIQKSTSEPFIITRCGHVFCLDCILSIYGIKGTKGTLRNLIAYAEYNRVVMCPICRTLQPCNRISSTNVWPPRLKTVIDVC